MEKIMNKSSKDASRLGHSTFEDRTLDALDDAELTAVTGGNSLSFGKLEFKYVQQHAD
jgi:hypothetical protein